MHPYTYTDNNSTFYRVDKRTARRAYNSGVTVVLCPCNLRPRWPYHPECHLNKYDYDEDGYQFNDVVTRFEWYNCSNRETGRYAAFYVED